MIVERPHGIYVRVVKPTFDRVVGFCIFVVLLPLTALVALAVRVSLGSPVFFRQRRVGRADREFDVYKFRTMGQDRRREAAPVTQDRRQTHKSDRDPRHTRVGRFLRKWSLDELPQFWNVVCGDMSLVGPRPELVEIVAALRALAAPAPSGEAGAHRALAGVWSGHGDDAPPHRGGPRVHRSDGRDHRPQDPAAHDPRHPAAQRQLAGVSAGEAHAQHGRSGSESMVSRRLEELDAGHPGHPLVRGDQPDPSAPKRELGPHPQRRGTGRGGTEHCDFAARTGDKGPVPRPGGG